MKRPQVSADPSGYHGVDPAAPDSAADLRLVRALEAVPKMEPPEDFALRVMSRLPQPRWLDRAALPSARVGPSVALAALLVLALAMWLLPALAHLPSARSAGPPTTLAIECLLCLEFVAITVWMTLAWREPR